VTHRMYHRLYQINHPYSLARALKAAIDAAIRENDAEVLNTVEALVIDIALSVDQFYKKNDAMRE